MANFELHSPKLNQLSKNAAQWDTNVKWATKRFLVRGTLLVQSNVIMEAPSRKGGLKRSIRSSIGAYEGIVYPTVTYAIFVHEGTKPHIIRPKNKKALSWKGIDHPIKIVKHPGQKANPFFERGVERSEREIDRYGEDLLNDLANGLTKGI